MLFTVLKSYYQYNCHVIVRIEAMLTDLWLTRQRFGSWEWLFSFNALHVRTRRYKSYYFLLFRTIVVICFISLNA